jgi:soluble lytic murein transglycosylase-like protein
VSTQSVGAIPTGMTAGELAVAQRVQQLQALIESARAVANGSTLAGTSAAGSASQSSSADFASALQSATAADSSASSGAAVPSGAYTPVSGEDVAYDPAATGPAPLADDPTGSTGLEYTGAQGAGETGASGEYESLIEQAAARNGVDPAVLHGLIQQESGFDPSAVSSAGASGLTQLMPGTASSLGVANPLDPAEAIEGGARYLGQLTSEFGGNTTDALAAYNAGPGAVQEYGGVPPYSETESYVSKVLGYAESYRQSHPATATGVLL